MYLMNESFSGSLEEDDARALAGQEKLESTQIPSACRFQPYDRNKLLKAAEAQYGGEDEESILPKQEPRKRPKPTFRVEKDSAIIIDSLDTNKESEEEVKKMPKRKHRKLSKSSESKKSTSAKKATKKSNDCDGGNCKDIVIEHFDEISFNRIVEGYFDKLDSNIHRFTTLECIEDVAKNRLIVEGYIKNNLGESGMITFEFKPSYLKEDGCVTFLAKSNQLSEGVNNNAPFRLTGKVGNRTLTLESLDYNQLVTTSNRVCGTITEGNNAKFVPTLAHAMQTDPEVRGKLQQISDDVTSGKKYWRDAAKDFKDLINSVDELSDREKRSLCFYVDKMNKDTSFYELLGTYMVGGKNPETDRYRRINGFI